MSTAHHAAGDANSRWKAENVMRAVLDRLHSQGGDIRLVVCDLSSSPHVDLAGARMLESLIDELRKENVVLRVAEARSAPRDLLRAEGLDEKVGGIKRFTSVADVVDDFLASS